MEQPVYIFNGFHPISFYYFARGQLKSMDIEYKIEVLVLNSYAQKVDVLLAILSDVGRMSKKGFNLRSVQVYENIFLNLKCTVLVF